MFATSEPEATALLLFLAGAAVYLLPSVIASIRVHHNAVPIFVVNLLLGWTVLAWIATLAWSLSSSPKVVIRFRDDD